MSCMDASKHYILRNVSFTLKPGERLAVLGYNGAGKTTLLESIIGYNPKTSGTALLGNKKLHSLRKEIGIVWDSVEIFPWLKVCEVISYFAAMRNVIQFKNPLYTLLGIEKLENKLMKVLSKGEKKKISIIIATMHNPQVLFFDELTADLDLQTIDMLWDNYLKFDKTIIFTTHNWKEAQQNATKFLFMHKGKMLIPVSSLVEIKERYPFKYKVILEESTQQLPKFFTTTYPKDGKINILLTAKDADNLCLLEKTANKMSVLPVELIDLYDYLTNSAL